MKANTQGTTKGKPFKPVTVDENVKLEMLTDSFGNYIEAKLGGPVARMYEELQFAKLMMKWQGYPVEQITPIAKISLTQSRKERERIAKFLKSQGFEVG